MAEDEAGPGEGWREAVQGGPQTLQRVRQERVF